VWEGRSVNGGTREEKRRGRSGEALRKGKERVMHRGMRRKSQ
jgi:hypothetical protein